MNSGACHELLVLKVFKYLLSIFEERGANLRSPFYKIQMVYQAFPFFILYKIRKLEVS